MSEKQLNEIAEGARFILAGYAFSAADNGFISILDLNDPRQACVLDKDGTMISTSMDETTQLLVQGYYLRNREFMESEHA